MIDVSPALAGSALQGSGEAARLPLTVRSRAEIAEGIVLFELETETRAFLPPGGAGAHISIDAPNGMTRKYSLCNAPGETDRYIIAVKREHDGRGGSRSIVDQVRPGDRINASYPRNDFALVGDAEHYVLVAGGIGITPIYAMLRQCEAWRKPYTLFYCTRNPAATAFREALSSGERSGRVILHHDDGDPGRALDFRALLTQPAPGTHLYCCGPRPLMEAVRQAAAHWPSGSVHFEDFGSSQPDGVPAGGFRVRLARSGRVVEVAADVTLMEALRRAGIDLPSSCEAGTCGTCKTRLLAGVADHRDLALFDDELDSYIMPCVSRAKSDEITLDL